MNLTAEQIEQVYEQDSFLHGRLVILNKFGVVGCEYADQCVKLANWLSENDIPFSTKGDFLVYLPTLEAGVQRALANN